MRGESTRYTCCSPNWSPAHLTSKPEGIPILLYGLEHDILVIAESVVHLFQTHTSLLTGFQRKELVCRQRFVDCILTERVNKVPEGGNTATLSYTVSGSIFLLESAFENTSSQSRLNFWTYAYPWP